MIFTRKDRRNTIDKLTDDVRFNTDSKAKSRFKKGIGVLISGGFRSKAAFKKAALIFMSIAKRTKDPIDKAYALGWAGRCYEDYGDISIAAIFYSAAVELAPSDVYALERLGDFYYEAKDDSAEAAKRYKQVLEYDPLSYRTYYKLGKLYSINGDSDKSIANHESAIKVNNGYVASMAEAAIESAKKGDKMNVLKFFRLAMANDLYEFEKLGDTIESCLI